jgi:hypothetical protein
MNDIRHPNDVTTQAFNSDGREQSTHKRGSTHRSGFLTHPTLASKLLILSLIVSSLAITLSLAGVAFRSIAGEKSPVKESQYQAVFIDGEPVAYFGKLRNFNNDYFQLSDVYYVQFLVQPQTDDKDKNSEQQPEPTLIKFGNEIHGPEDVMYIRKDRVRAIENLKDNGKVVEAITKFKSGQQ